METHFWPKALRLFIATVLVAAVAMMVSATPATAGPYDDLLVLDVGHVDGLDIQSQGDQIVLNVYDDRDALNAVTRDPGDVLFHITTDAAFDIPEGLPPSYAFLGEPGTTVWLLPMTQSDNPDVVWLGWASQRVAPGVITGNLTLRMVEVDGPGEIMLFQSDAFGNPINKWGSADGLSPSVTVLPNAHVHSNWVFTAPGAYTVTFEATGTSTATGETISTGQEQYTFHVGPLPEDPVETTLTIGGLQPEYQTGDTVTLNAVQNPDTGEDQYHWFVKAEGASDFTVINGAFDATYSFTATAEHDRAQYLVRLYDHDHAVIAESAPVELSIADDEPEPLLSQIITATIDEGDGALVVSVDPDDRSVTMGAFVLASDGERWESTGELRPVLVTDTRSSKPGWNVSGQVGDFKSGASTLSAQHLGWTPAVVSQAPGQGAVAGAGVNPGASSGDGLSVGRPLVSAPAGAGFGTATAGGQLHLHAPTSAEPGTYTGVLTLTAI